MRLKDTSLAHNAQSPGFNPVPSNANQNSRSDCVLKCFSVPEPLNTSNIDNNCMDKSPEAKGGCNHW